MAAETKPHLTPEEYLEIERAADFKSEYFAGEMFALRGGPEAMAGGTRAHALLTANLVALLHAALRGTDCLVYSSDLRLHVPAAGLYTYPDLSVVCGEAQMQDAHDDNLLNPTLLVEVLSPSTESYDRGQKFAFYRLLGSLREYVLVSQREPHVEVFRKNAEGLWVLHDFDAARGAVELASVEVVLTLDEIYANVPLGGISLR